MLCGTVGRALMGTGVIGGLIRGIRDGRLRPAALHDMTADCLILPSVLYNLYYYVVRVGYDGL